MPEKTTQSPSGMLVTQFDLGLRIAFGTFRPKPPFDLFIRTSLIPINPKATTTGTFGR